MMGKRYCVYALMVTLLWLALASRPAAAETRIEVDENGDEYELKRFFIQGRQLNGSGSQSQCVVTRRKRASRALQAQPQAGLTVTSQTLGVSAPEHREAIAEQPKLQQLQSGNRRYVALTALHLDGQLLTPAQEDDDDDEEEEAEEGDDDEEEEGADEDDEEEEEVEQEQPQTVQLVDATQQQKQLSQSPSIVAATFTVPLAQATPVNVVSTAAHLPQGVSVVANAATHANVGGDAGIVVVQSEQPPKVNPSTHAVFELKPLRQQQQQQQLPAQTSPAFAFWPQQLTDDDEQDEQDEDEDEDADADDYFYYGPGGATGNRYQDLAVFDEHEHIITEDSPVSTTAIWSTSPEEDIRPVNQKKKQQQINRNKKKQQQIKRNKKKQQQEQEQDLEQEQELEQELDVKPIKEQKQKRKQQQQSLSSDGDRKKPAKKPSSSSSSSSSSSNKRKRPSSSSSSSSNKRKSKPSKRQKKKKSKPSSSSSSSSSGSSSSGSSVANKRRRKPSSAASSSSSSGSSSSRPMGGYRRRRPQQSQQQQQQKRRRQQQQQQKRRRQQQQQRRRRNKNRQNGNGNSNRGGNGGGNRRQQWDNEPIINCIYINKDPPTTTQRPFWNILGRDAVAGQQPKDVAGDDAVQVPQHDVESEQAVRQAMRRSSGDFGHRKRATLRFAA